MVLSTFYYCYPACGNSITMHDAQRVQKIQNSTLRYVFSLRREDHVSEYRDAFNMLCMGDFCRLMTNSMTHKVLTLKEPQYLSERLRYRDEVSQRDNPQRDRKLHFRRVRLELGRKSFSYFVPALYNDLPSILKTCSLTRFKSKLKDCLLKET